MKFIYLLLALGLFLSTQKINAQYNPNSNSEKIHSSLINYFQMDRENIHLHLNKTQYLSTDDIWFKGYITERKNNLPYEATSNVLVDLIDEKGTILKSSLFYAENSTFDGRIKLGKSLKTGIYYLQVYTNYMNNYSEDESSVYKIFILNTEENKTVKQPELNLSSIVVEFTPESGILLDGITNTISVKITDCNNNPIQIKDGVLLNSKGVVVTNFYTSELGYGKFDFFTEASESYTISCTYRDTKIEKQLPKPSFTGIALSVNNYTFADKTILKFKTNDRTLKNTATSTYSIIVQKNNSASYFNFTFDNKTEKTLVISTGKMNSGINTIRVFDNDLNQILERNIFVPIYKPNTPIDLKITRNYNDSIQVKGSSSMKLAELSISVLPENNVQTSNFKSIYSSKIFDELKESIPNELYFINDFSKKKHMELDNILISKTSKYDWRNILKNTPEKKYDFDFGLDIKGSVNTDIKSKSDYKINMTNLALGFNEFTSLNEQNEFNFKNLMVSDSAIIHFSLLNKRAEMKALKLYSRVTNNNRKFLKHFTPKEQFCSEIFESFQNLDDFFPKDLNSILLDNVTVKTKQKQAALKNLTKLGNSMAKGYKISEKERASFSDVLMFIASHGYDVITQAGTVAIYSRSTTSILGSKSPAVFIDDSPVSDFNLLLNMSLQFVDEIYINKRGFGGGMNSANGVITIYTSKGIPTASNSPKIKSGSLVVSNGFQPAAEFKTPRYNSLLKTGFLNYGTINWIPKVNTDTNGDFVFEFPNLYQKKVLVFIEGISSDGELISQIQTLEVPYK